MLGKCSSLRFCVRVRVFLLTCNYEYLIYPGIINFKFKDFEAAVADLSTCVKLDKENKSAYTYIYFFCKDLHIHIWFVLFLKYPYYLILGMLNSARVTEVTLLRYLTYCCVGFGIDFSWWLSKGWRSTFKSYPAWSKLPWSIVSSDTGSTMTDFVNFLTWWYFFVATTNIFFLAKCDCSLVSMRLIPAKS